MSKQGSKWQRTCPGEAVGVGVMLSSIVPVVFTYNTNSKIKLLRVTRQQSQSIKAHVEALLCMRPYMAMLVTWLAQESGPHSNREL